MTKVTIWMILNIFKWFVDFHVRLKLGLSPVALFAIDMHASSPQMPYFQIVANVIVLAYSEGEALGMMGSSRAANTNSKKRPYLSVFITFWQQLSRMPNPRLIMMLNTVDIMREDSNKRTGNMQSKKDSLYKLSMPIFYYSISNFYRLMSYDPVCYSFKSNFQVFYLIFSTLSSYFYFIESVFLIVFLISLLTPLVLLRLLKQVFLCLAPPPLLLPSLVFSDRVPFMNPKYCLKV